MRSRIDQLAEKIERAIRAAYLERGWRRFEPRQFVPEEFGPIVDVSAAMLRLSERGQLVDRATILCDEAHSVWRGPFSEVERHRGDLCRRCHDDESCTGTLVELHFEISEAWERELDAETAQKKTPQSEPYHHA